jgi:hypothetical protein
MSVARATLVGQIGELGGEVLEADVGHVPGDRNSGVPMQAVCPAGK